MELEETTNRVYKRFGKTLKKVYRCPSGFRKGKVVSSLDTCFAPRKRASTRIKLAIAAKKRSAVRTQKTRIANKKSIHFRLKRLNNALRGRR